MSPATGCSSRESPMSMTRRISFLSFLTLIFLSASGAIANSLSCKQVFTKNFKVSEFIIQVGGKKESANFLASAHENLISTFQLSNLLAVLKRIKFEGVDNLTADERKLIIKFRQNSSLLRSIFQTTEESHQSPKEFAHFVRDFGVLKDYLLMGDNEAASEAANKILSNYKNIDLDSLLEDFKPASKKSVAKYFAGILKDTKEIMAKETVSYDEIHDVRKNLRDVLRYMQISNEVSSGKEMQESAQVEFLKKINEKLGEICDENAAKILRAEISENSPTIFPEKIRPRVEYFLDHFRIQVN